MLCDDLERWDGGGMRGRLKREEIDVYIQFIHSVLQKKLIALYSNYTPIIKKKNRTHFFHDTSLLVFFQEPQSNQYS